MGCRESSEVAQLANHTPDYAADLSVTHSTRITNESTTSTSTTSESNSSISLAYSSCTKIHRSHAPITRSNHTPASYTAIVHSDHTLLSHNPIIHSHRTLESYTPLAHFSLTQSDRKKPHYWSYQYSEKYCCAYFILFAQSLYTSAGQASDPARHRGGRGGARRPLYVRWTRLSSWPRQLLQHPHSDSAHLSKP